VALGAYQSDVLVGVAGYETLADPRAAEIGLVVDGGRARGPGALLLEHLASVARHRGVCRFVAEVLIQDHRVIHVIADAGLTYRTHTDGPEHAVVIPLYGDDRCSSSTVRYQRSQTPVDASIGGPTVPPPAGRD
jgi:GNAT superfamily N-acetyltransferase